MMPPQPEAWGAHSGASTAPTSRPETTPVYDPSAGYQPTVPPMYSANVPPYAPPRKRSPLGWILAFIGMGLFVLVVIAVMMMARFGRKVITDIPNVPPPLVMQPGENVFSADNADQAATTVGNETALTKTFALADNAKFSIKNINGSITVEAWDQPKAEVKVIKRNSDRGTQVIFSFSANSLAFRTGAARNGGKQDVRYEVKLPRQMGSVDLTSVNGSIKLSDVSGQIVLESSNGNIELSDVVGVSSARTTNGKITAVLEEATEGRMEFTAVNGHIFITIKSDFDANLEASTVHGSIDIDAQFGIPVERQIVGQHASGQIGSGGPSLKLTTVNGGISLKKQ